ncbi:MAG: enoyl-CoA hydratase/isomerase family protein [Planctomycetota bacterium]
MITTEQDGGVTTIWLDRPDRRNALTPGMLTEIVSAAREASDRGDAVILAGRGNAFCAGFDLSLCQASPDGAAMRLLLSALSDACLALRTIDRPVVVAAHGAAIAGGCALLGGADTVVADRRAVLGYPVARLGVSPAVSVPFLRQSVTDGRARASTLLPDTFTGEDACRMGLVHVLVDSADDVYGEAVHQARLLAGKPTHAFAATKRWLNSIEGVERRGDAGSGLEASLALTGGEEERVRISALDIGRTSTSRKDRTHD